MKSHPLLEARIREGNLFRPKVMNEVLKELSRALDWRDGRKLKHISQKMTKRVNFMMRGAKRCQKTPIEIYGQLFNGLDDQPQGEFSELRHELDKQSGSKNYLGDLGDCLYNALRYPFRKNLTNHIFAIGHDIGLMRRNIIDGCIIKYTSRCENMKQYEVERIMLQAYLDDERLPEPSEVQIQMALQRIEYVISHRGYFAPPGLPLFPVQATPSA